LDLSLSGVTFLGSSETETDGRKRGFKRPSLNFTDRKVLRVIKEDERRKGVRNSVYSGNRALYR
jgi:hypothetical protein